MTSATARRIALSWRELGGAQPDGREQFAKSLERFVGAIDQLVAELERARAGDARQHGLGVSRRMGRVRAKH